MHCTKCKYVFSWALNEKFMHTCLYMTISWLTFLCQLFLAILVIPIVVVDSPNVGMTFHVWLITFGISSKPVKKHVSTIIHISQEEYQNVYIWYDIITSWPWLAKCLEHIWSYVYPLFISFVEILAILTIDIICWCILHVTHLQCSQAREQSSPYFLQIHFIEWHPGLQL